MGWNVILASVVVSAAVSATVSIIITKMNIHAKRKDFRYAKLYDILTEIQEYQAPPLRPLEDQTTNDITNQHVMYYSFLIGKFDLSKPLLSNKIIEEIDAELKEHNLLDVNLETFREVYIERFRFNVEFRRTITKGIQKQLTKLK